MDRFNEMQAFVMVANAGSITRAAERLEVAKSVISRRLTDLESRLDVQLFQRTTRRLHLTDSGRSFYAHAHRVLSDLEEAERAVASEHGALKGKIRAALPHSFGTLHLVPAIDEFMRVNPGIEFDVDLNDRQVDLLQEGFDLAVRISKLDDSSLIARRLAPIRRVTCASPAYLKKHGVPKDPTELSSHIGLGYSNVAEPDVWSYRDLDGSARTVKIPLRATANNGVFLEQLAIAGHGIISGPTFYVYDAVKRGKLRVILDDFFWPDLNAYALYPHTRHLSTRVRAFIDFLIARFAGEPYWDREIASAVKR